MRVVRPRIWVQDRSSSWVIPESYSGSPVAGLVRSMRMRQVADKRAIRRSASAPNVTEGPWATKSDSRLAMYFTPSVTPGATGPRSPRSTACRTSSNRVADEIVSTVGVAPERMLTR